MRKNDHSGVPENRRTPWRCQPLRSVRSSPAPTIVVAAVMHWLSLSEMSGTLIAIRSSSPRPRAETRHRPAVSAPARCPSVRTTWISNVRLPASQSASSRMAWTASPISRVRAPGSRGVDEGAGLGCVHREARGGRHRRLWVSTDDNVARCVPRPRDAASLLPVALSAGFHKRRTQIGGGVAVLPEWGGAAPDPEVSRGRRPRQSVVIFATARCHAGARSRTRRCPGSSRSPARPAAGRICTRPAAPTATTTLGRRTRCAGFMQTACETPDVPVWLRLAPSREPHSSGEWC